MLFDIDIDGKTVARFNKHYMARLWASENTDQYFEVYRYASSKMNKRSMTKEEIKEALELKESGFTWKEVGENLGLSHTAIMQRVKRAYPTKTTTGSRISDKDKQRIIEMYESGTTKRELERIFSISRSSVYYIIQRNEEKNQILGVSG